MDPEELQNEDQGVSEQEARIHQADNQHSEVTGILETIVTQNIEKEKRDGAQSEQLDHILIKTDEGKKATEKSAEMIVEAIKDLKTPMGDVPATLAGIGKTLEILSNKTGGRFLGIVETEKDLPEDAEKGDFAIVKENGSLYYV